jgi:hypothetical protein
MVRQKAFFRVCLVFLSITKVYFLKKFNMKTHMTQFLLHSETGPSERECGFLCWTVII